MSLPAGAEVYVADKGSVLARGSQYTNEEIDSALAGHVTSILWDDAGTVDLEMVFADLISTSFGDELVQEVLRNDPSVEDWRVGEAFAEAYLVDHCNCEFPWPTGRDLKNPNASPAGTDLVGFRKVNGQVHFAFGEVKTSPQPKWPPDIMKGRHGLKGQLERLYETTRVKNELVRYLGLHAVGKVWCSTYQSASARYFNDPDDVSLYGLLIRDVEPKKQDLAGRARSLSKNSPTATQVQLRAFYLPKKSIGTLENRAKAARKKSL